MNEQQRQQAEAFASILRERVEQAKYKAYIFFDGRCVRIQAQKGYKDKVNKLAAEVKQELLAKSK